MSTTTTDTVFESTPVIRATDSKKEAIELLNKYFLLECKWQLKDLIWIVAVLVILTLMIRGLMLYFDGSDIKSPFAEAFKISVTICGAIIVYWQWLAARYEVSLDKYYDRIDVANKRLETAYSDAPNLAFHLHIFAELDKLEYVILKYRLGYISPVLALRAILNFRGHCQFRNNFSQEACQLIKRTYYLPETKRIARLNCSQCSR